MRDVAFFQTAATVIPILFVAVVLTLRRFDPTKVTLQDAFFGVATISVAAYGEFTAFLVLAGAEPSTGTRLVVGWALFILGSEAIYATIIPLFGRIFSENRKVFAVAAVVYFSIMALAFVQLMTDLKMGAGAQTTLRVDVDRSHSHRGEIRS